MDPIADLKRDFTMLLQEEFKKQLLAGENVVISLPGSFGEGLAVTDQRVFVIRECEQSGGCNTHVYPLGSVSGAEASASGAGGYIELKVATAPADHDEARVYFPSYDLPAFQAAAEYLAKAASQRAVVATAAQPSTAAVAPGASACPGCGAAIGIDSTFCGQCGAQVRLRCAECGSSSPAGVKFCDACGKEFTEGAVSCGKCGARVTRWQAFCTECGSIQHQTCAGCGSPVQDEWKYCAGCGRQLGTGYINPRGNVARTLREQFDSQQTTGQGGAVFGGSTLSVPAPPEEASPTTAPIEPAPVSSTAEAHNVRGRELFENDDIAGAIAEFSEAVNADPTNPSYHCNLAVALDEDGQDAEALAQYEATLRLDPNDLTALLSLGYMYNENEERDKAQEVWGKLLKIAPDSAEAQEVQEGLRNQENL